MFFRKKEKVSWPIIIFGIISLGIVISIVVLVVVLISRVDSDKVQNVSKGIISDSVELLNQKDLG